VNLVHPIPGRIYLTFSMILFLLGIWGIFLNRKNILIMLMSIELMLLAVDLNFLVFSVDPRLLAIPTSCSRVAENNPKSH
jgi:NADH:ubiquinone oxidoreductase subunit K